VDYKNTLNLPKTEFPMRANLPVREPLRIASWDKDDIYRKMVDANPEDGPRFILHDGPPYANGHIHSGTVLNKVLKDFVVKYRNMSGQRCEYVPGWDCHGLPIENNVEREEGKSKDAFQVDVFRNKCRDYALRFVDVQKEEFKRLGVLGDWDNPYLTVHPSYEATIAREFGKVVGQGALYKRKRPVYWCAKHVTALAEAEVEYEELSSPSIWVKFRLNQSAREKLPFLPADKDAYVVIWTTTPWTLPANLAITLHPALEYSLLDAGNEAYFVATERAASFASDCGLSGLKQMGIVRGTAMERATCKHPFVDRDSLIILADFVTIETGTGCVHTAPGHGADDYEVGLKYGLDAYAPVDDRGCFTADVPQFQGRFVFDSDPDVIKLLQSKNALLKAGHVKHQYPICQRCKKPIVFRATSQWFISMDKTGIRQKALSAIPGVSWIPERGAQRIGAMVGTRPDWCLSRQRLWGVPIIAFYCKKCGTPLLSKSVVDHVADLFAKEGAGAWFTNEPASLMPPGTACGHCGATDFTRETDIVDVWFESGVSYAAVIEQRYGPDAVTDLYLEGSDQHRGWFQSALLESVLSRDRAPYKAVLTHGFVVDGEGRKISKTLGNFVPPEDIIKKYGAEIYRLWTAAENYQEDVRISDEILKTLVDAYMKLRNTFRFLLSNLAGFDPAADPVPQERMLPLDRFILHRTSELLDGVKAAYESYTFHDIFQSVTRFFSVDLSSFYLDIIKDRLYVLPTFSPARRSARTALYHMASALARALAPILSFTCDEVWEHMPAAGGPTAASSATAGSGLAGTGAGAGQSIFAQRFPSDFSTTWRAAGVAGDFAQLLQVRDAALKDMEEKRRNKVIGHSLEAHLDVEVGRHNPAASVLRTHREYLEELFIVSSLAVTEVDGDGLTVASKHASGGKCVRCWHWAETTGADPRHEGVCGRCSGILREIEEHTGEAPHS